jgi:GT2 family glycosyltransferase
MRKLLIVLLFHLVLRPTRKVCWLITRFLRAAVGRMTAVYQRLDRLVITTARKLQIQTKMFAGQAEPKGDAKLLLSYLQGMSHRLAGLPYRPVISILVPVYKVRPQYLQEALDSIAAQVSPDWEVCLVDDASGDPRLTAVIEAFAAEHPGKVRTAVNTVNSHISATSNRCLELATGDYVALLDHDDRLLPHSLSEMVRFINLHDRPEVLYSDERVIDEEGNHLGGPFYKPDWSPFLHLSVNYTTHLTVYRRDFLERIGGFRVGYEGAQDHDLMLRAVEAATKPIVHVPFVLYQWRAADGSTAKTTDAKPYAAVNGIKAVMEACQRRGMPAEVEFEPELFHYRLKFRLPSERPRVSILIPTKDHPGLLRTCLSSILDQSVYDNFEIVVVDNGTTDEEALALLSEMASTHPDRVRIVTDDRPFNFAALINLAAAHARGEYYLLLNNDTKVVAPEWIEELLRVAHLSNVGAVGCKLLYPNLTIQHAGIVLIDRRIAAHSLRFFPSETTAYCGMANTLHEVCAVTAACLMVSARKFAEVGGFDETYLPNGFGDVDFCLKLRQAGYVNLYTPYATLIHYESPSRGRTIEDFERMVMLRRWPAELLNDPYLNYHLERHADYIENLHDETLDVSPDVLATVWPRTAANDDSLAATKVSRPIAKGQEGPGRSNRSRPARGVPSSCRPGSVKLPSTPAA